MAEFKEDWTILPFDAPVPSNAIDSAQPFNNKESDSKKSIFFRFILILYIWFRLKKKLNKVGDIFLKYNLR